MEPQGGRGISPFRVTKRSTKLRRLSKTTRRSRVHVQTVGLNAETKKVSAPSPWGNISLDIPFYRTFWRGTAYSTKKSFTTDTGKPFTFQNLLVGAAGLEPTTFGLKDRCSTTQLRPHKYKP